MTMFATLFIACLFLAPPLYAQDSYSEFERGLELSGPQREQVESIRNKYMGEWQLLRQESMRKRLELRELNRDPQANAEKIGRLRDEVRGLDTAKQNVYRQYRSEVSRSLSDKQRQRYNTFCDQERRKGPPRSMRPGRHGR